MTKMIHFCCLQMMRMMKMMRKDSSGQWNRSDDNRYIVRRRQEVSNTWDVRITKFMPLVTIQKSMKSVIPRQKMKLFWIKSSSQFKKLLNGLNAHKGMSHVFNFLSCTQAASYIDEWLNLCSPCTQQVPLLLNVWLNPWSKMSWAGIGCHC